jgi:hypothetical protein
MNLKVDFNEIENIKIDKVEISSNKENKKESSKNSFWNLIKPKSSGEFWTLTLNIPILFSILYFFMNGYYKIKMGRNYNLPSEYFNISLSEVFYYLFLLFVIPVLLLCMKVLFKPLELQNLGKVFKILIIFILEIFIFIFICKEILYKIENSLRNNYIFTTFSTIYIALIFFSILYFFSKNRTIYFLNLLWSILFYFTLNTWYIPITFSITIIILTLLSLKYEKYHGTIIFISCIIHLIILVFLIFCVEKNNYEILYQNGKEVRVIITTYEDKYLIADGIIEDIEDKNNNKKKMLNINTDNYKFIKIEKAEGIKNEEFYKVNIEPNKKFI